MWSTTAWAKRPLKKSERDATRGMLVLYGMSSGPVPPVDPAKLSEKGSLYMARTTLAHFTATREELLARTSALFA